jgi:hypothetical protein
MKISLAVLCLLLVVGLGFAYKSPYDIYEDEGYDDYSKIQEILAEGIINTAGKITSKIFNRGVKSYHRQYIKKYKKKCCSSNNEPAYCKIPKLKCKGNAMGGSSGDESAW